MPYYQFLQAESKIIKLQGEMLPPSKKEKTGHKSISLHPPLTKEGNQYASEKKHLIYSIRDDWSLSYNVCLPIAKVHQALSSKDPECSLHFGTLKPR